MGALWSETDSGASPKRGRRTSRAVETRSAPVAAYRIRRLRAWPPAHSPLLEATTVQEDPRSDRDWEHWPGRKTTDEGIRQRLRALFSATDDEALEARIEEKGREIEEHTDQLQATIGDLERREARAGQLRTAVEEMLRHGSAELDERHAALTQHSLDLAAREERIRAEERDIAVRKQELGAVELRRAAVERRESAAAEREAALERRAKAIDEREEALSAASPGDLVTLHRVEDDPAQEAAGQLLVFAANGFRTVERPGKAAVVGSVVTVEGVDYTVVRVGRSPRPGDHRARVYLEKLAADG
jgi:hypothetical protein